MGKNQIELRPTYWASFSGGKDSFYMIHLILNNLDRYPLDGVVHYELEIDYPFIKDVVDFVEKALTDHGVRMLRIKPREKWEDLYEKHGYPTRIARWCNKYKLDCNKQHQEMMRQQGKKVINYIGFCADEVKRFKFELNQRENVTQIYPLAEMGIEEKYILEWAQNQDIYRDYYKYNKRCGCMCCPMSSYDNLVYTKKYYPEQYNYFMQKALETERMMSERKGRPFSIWDGHSKYNTEYKMKRVDTLLANETTQLTVEDWLGKDSYERIKYYE